MPPEPFHPEALLESWRQRLEDWHPHLDLQENGMVMALEKGVAHVSGLRGTGSEEVLTFAGGCLGLALNLDEDIIGAVLLDEDSAVRSGTSVRRTGQRLAIGSGDGLLGRVIDAVGRPLDGGGPIDWRGSRPIEMPAPAMMQRAEVSRPLETGIKVIDAMIPIGRGQRQLILGDRQTGKTSLAVDTILHQKGQGMVCIYCAIGQRMASIAKVITDLREWGGLAYTVVMAASNAAAPGLQYITPYAATAIAEQFVVLGRDVLVVYDDLTAHAEAYRELSLLLRRPPGREAYPGDIFYLHSRLLERAAQMSAQAGGAALTALPIVETEAEDLSAYIPTNLISITDGQVYLSPRLFRLGTLPAVDVGMSVSRVGGKAQVVALRDVAKAMRLAYAQFQELEGFARLGARLDPATQAVLDRGRRVRELLKQNQYHTLQGAEQVLLNLALAEGLFDAVPLDQMAGKEAQLVTAWRAAQQSMDTSQKLSEETRRKLLEMARAALADPHAQ